LHEEILHLEGRQSVLQDGGEEGNGGEKGAAAEHKVRIRNEIRGDTRR